MYLIAGLLLFCLKGVSKVEICKYATSPFFVPKSPHSFHGRIELNTQHITQPSLERKFQPLLTQGRTLSWRIKAS